MKLSKKENKILILLCLFAYSCSTPLIESQNTNSKTNTINSTLKKNIVFTKITSEELESLNNYIRMGMSNASGAYIQPFPTSTPVLSLPTTLSTDSGSNYNQPPTYTTFPPTSSPTSYPNYQPIPYPTYIPTPYPVGTYFGSPETNNFDEYILYEFEKAKIEGYKGSYLTVVNDLINPILAGLADDTRLISASGSTDKTGINQNNPLPGVTPTPGSIINNDNTVSYITVPKTYQWQFTYTSSSKKEVYSILVNSNETLVLRQKWKLRGYNSSDIKIDSTKAIEITEQAIMNRNFPSSIEYSPYEATYLYEIPEKANISYNLSENENHELVWYIIISHPDYNQSYAYSEGYSTVNAKTGELISLKRMAKVSRFQDPNNPNIFVTPSPDSINYQPMK